MKYKINNNDNTNTTSKDIVKKDTIISSKEFNSKSKLNIKKKKKKKILLFSLYLLAFGSTSTTMVLFLHTNITFNNYEFNPNANNKLWDDYYQRHHHNAKPINLDSTFNYFSDSKKIVNFNVTQHSGSNINFTNILSSIDSNLQKEGIEVTPDNNDQNLLPINFFLNANFNPAVKFTIGKDKKPITNTSFSMPSNFNQSNNYILNLTTNNESSVFGIKNKNGDISIHIKITNMVTINISNLQLNFRNKTITIANPKNATIDSIKNEWLIPEIKEEFVKTLSSALNVDKAQIKDNYYRIDFDDAKEPKDFTQNVIIKFSITSLTNPWHFTGKSNYNISVINDVINLKNINNLRTVIEEQYNNDNNQRSFQITLDNQKGKDNKYTNADVNLSAEDLTFVNNQIIKAVQSICQDYFKKNYSTFAIQKSDYIISTNLKLGDNIFNNKLGKSIQITIAANPNTNKLENRLDNINAIIHGRNKNNITNNYTSPTGFALDGIYLRSGNSKNILQEGQRFYKQKKLLQNWITNPDSLLNKIKKSSYDPSATKFSGQFTINWELDNGPISQKTFNIGRDITSSKVKKFWDLINNTKAIYLETNISTTRGWSLENVKLIFTNVDDKPNAYNTLYTFDLSDKFNGISIIERASLTFPTFDFDFDYQLVS